MKSHCLLKNLLFLTCAMIVVACENIEKVVPDNTTGLPTNSSKHSSISDDTTPEPHKSSGVISRPVISSGSRLKARLGRTPDGAQIFLGWFDTQRQENCDFAIDMAAGIQRCFPDSRYHLTWGGDEHGKLFKTPDCSGESVGVAVANSLFPIPSARPEYIILGRIQPSIMGNGSDTHFAWSTYDPLVRYVVHVYLPTSDELTEQKEKLYAVSDNECRLVYENRAMHVVTMQVDEVPLDAFVPIEEFLQSDESIAPLLPLPRHAPVTNY